MPHPIEFLIQKCSPKTVLEHENALKEIIQEITLTGLARTKFFDKAAFYGGTALRIFHGLPRFSEDLDFTLLKENLDFKLKPFFSGITQTLQSFGFEVAIEEVTKAQTRKVESAFLKANTRMHLLKIDATGTLSRKVQSNKIMTIKFEVDVQAPLGFETEVLTLFPPLTASVSVLKPSSLFAGKMHAILFRDWKGRVKGRDYYDLLWYLGRRIPLKLGYLEQKMKDGGKIPSHTQLSREEVIKRFEDRIAAIDWEKAKKDVMPFLRDPLEVQPWSTDFFHAAIPHLVCLP